MLCFSYSSTKTCLAVETPFYLKTGPTFCSLSTETASRELDQDMRMEDGVKLLKLRDSGSKKKRKSQMVEQGSIGFHVSVQHKIATIYALTRFEFI